MVGKKNGKISRAEAIARRFGVTRNREHDQWLQQARMGARDVVSACVPGRVLLITGASGSGKSVLLRELAQQLEGRAVVCQESGDEGRLVIDSIPWLELEDALDVLGAFGLGEVYTYLSPASQLSTGQRSRLRLAVGYARAVAGHGRVLLADEFGTQLDGFSAAVIARNLRRVVTREGNAAAVVASCHGELETPLRPDIVVECDFGEYRVRRT